MGDQNTYKTDSAWLVATLRSYGFMYSDIQTIGDRKWFIFPKSKDLDTAISTHYAGTLNVPSRLMETNYKDILDLVKDRANGQPNTRTK